MQRCGHSSSPSGCASGGSDPLFLRARRDIPGPLSRALRDAELDDLATLPGGARRTAPELGSTREFNSGQQGVAGSKEHEFETSVPDYAIAEPVVVATCIPTLILSRFWFWQCFSFWELWCCLQTGTGRCFVCRFWDVPC